MNWLASLETGNMWIVRGHPSLSLKPPSVPLPTSRGKQGTKQSVLCDRRGLPLALSIEGANPHDSKLLFLTLDALSYERPEPTLAVMQNLCLDAAYEHDPNYGELYERGYEPHMWLNAQYHKWYQPPQDNSNSLELNKMPRRWVVERLFSWLNR